MPSIEDAKKVLAISGYGLHALEAIGKLAKDTLGIGGGTRALAALHAIAGVVDAVGDSLAQNKTVEDIAASIDLEIAKLSRSLADNDAATRGEVDAKFGE